MEDLLCISLNFFYISNGRIKKFEKFLYILYKWEFLPPWGTAVGVPPTVG
jgi:hypothetical protein